MMTGFLLAYVAFTLPLFAFGLRQAWKKRHPKQVPNEVTDLIKEAFGKHGLVANVHEIPQTPEEAIVVMSQEILKAIRQSETLAQAWFSTIRDRLVINKGDMDAMMKATEALTKGLLALQERESVAVKQEPKIEQFLYDLEYVRDKFVDTPSQKKVIESIISKVKTQHGTGTK